MMYSDNPHRDAARHDRKQQEWLDSRPICWACKDPIQEDTCLSFNEHKYHHDCREAWADDAAKEFTEATI